MPIVPACLLAPAVALLPHAPPASAARCAGSASLRRLLRHAALVMALVCGAFGPVGTASAAETVGLTRLSVGGLPVTLVYPSSAPAKTLQQGDFALGVALDGEPMPGLRRLVLMSHGSGGSDLADHGLAATLARVGFVVAQPLHAGDNFRDSSQAGQAAWRTRPGELLQVLDALAAHPQWGPRLQLDRVGVHGMSAGGVSALVLAGGRWRTLNLVRHCLAHGEADLGFCYSGAPDAKAQAERRARFERARGVPELFLPRELKAEQGGRAGTGDPRPDARIAAVTVAVPVVAPFSSESLARIALPLGVVSADRDMLLLPTFHSDRLLRECTRCEPLAQLAGAGHFDLLEPWPAAAAARAAAQQPRGGEPEPGFDPAARQRAFDAIAAFHRRHLGDATPPAGQ